MSLPLTPERIAAVYGALRHFPPFNRMKLPPADNVEFNVTRKISEDASWQQYCRLDEHVINVSEKRNGHWNTLSISVAHEMIHLHQSRAKTETSGAQHNADFHRLAKLVCKRFGWDVKQFV